MSPRMAQNEPKVRQGAGGWVLGMCFLREGDLGNKIPAGSALLLSDILSTDRSLHWNPAQSRNRRRWEMVSDVPGGKKALRISDKAREMWLESWGRVKTHPIVLTKSPSPCLSFPIGKVRTVPLRAAFLCCPTALGRPRGHSTYGAALGSAPHGAAAPTLTTSSHN